MFFKKRDGGYVVDRITVFSRKRVVFEGIERIVSCNSETMIVEKKGRIVVEGEDLVLRELGNSNVSVSGKLSALLFQKEEE